MVVQFLLGKNFLSGKVKVRHLPNRVSHLKIPPSISTYIFERFFKAVSRKFFNFVELQNFRPLWLCKITHISKTLSRHILQKL